MSTAIPKNVHGEVRGIAIYVHSNPEKCPWRVRGIAIYVHSNPEKCPWRGPSNSNLCPQAIQKNVHAEVRRTAIYTTIQKKLSMA